MVYSVKLLLQLNPMQMSPCVKLNSCLATHSWIRRFPSIQGRNSIIAALMKSGHQGHLRLCLLMLPGHRDPYVHVLERHTCKSLGEAQGGREPESASPPALIQ